MFSCILILSFIFIILFFRPKEDKYIFSYLYYLDRFKNLENHMRKNNSSISMKNKFFGN